MHASNGNYNKAEVHSEETICSGGSLDFSRRQVYRCSKFDIPYATFTKIVSTTSPLDVSESADVTVVLACVGISKDSEGREEEGRGGEGKEEEDGDAGL